jgi:putative flippase GtrA
VRLARTLAQALRFGLVGLSNTAITYLTFLLFYRVFGIQEYLANGASYLIGLANSFVWNKLWTFGSRGFNAAELLMFAAVFLASYGLQLLAYRLLRSAGLPAEAVQALAMIAYTAANFAGNKLLTFRERPRAG